MPEDEDHVVLDRIRAGTGVELARTGHSEHGTLGGAILVDLPDGRPGVVTRFLGAPEQARTTAAALNQVRDRGLPVPRQHLVAAFDTDVFLVQERLPGAPATKITPELITRIVEVNDRFADALAEGPELATISLCLTASGDPFPRHEVLQRHSDRSRGVLEAIRSIGRRHPGDMTADDLLHIDLDVPNVLFDEDGRVTGVVDWNLGAYRGDRHLALVKTRF